MHKTLFALALLTMPAALAGGDPVCELDPEAEHACTPDDYAAFLDVGVYVPGDDACPTPEYDEALVAQCVEFGYYAPVDDYMVHVIAPDIGECEAVTEPIGCASDDPILHAFYECVEKDNNMGWQDCWEKFFGGGGGGGGNQQDVFLEK